MSGKNGPSRRLDLQTSKWTTIHEEQVINEKVLYVAASTKKAYFGKWSKLKTIIFNLASTIIFVKHQAKQNRNEEKDLQMRQPITGKIKLWGSSEDLNGSSKKKN